MALDQAVQAFVTQGCHISLGGFTLNRNPMAAVHEIIRQEINGLHIYAHSNGQGLDELIGAGCIRRVEIAYSGNGRFAPTCICFKRHIKENRVQVEDYTNFQMALRFQAGAMGVPFLPVLSSLGTDIIEKWGFDADTRSGDPRIASRKLVTLADPFSSSDTPQEVVLVPAIQPDVTILHTQTADRSGTTRIDGLTFCDVDQAKAARHVIVTCEEIVETGALNDEPGRNQLPSFCVDAVVHVPFGAYPTACYRRYDYDPRFLDRYREAAATEAGFQAFMENYILAAPDHKAMAEQASGSGLELLKADPVTGYSKEVKR